MNPAYKNYVAAIKILAQLQEDAELASPNIVVLPSEPVIQKAVRVLQRMDPKYFVGIRKIMASASPYFGHVESGPNKDPTIVNLNVNRIIQMSGGDRTGPDAILAAAIVIAHEVAHTKSFNSEQGFVGGETVAEAEERRVEAWIKNNRHRLVDILGS